MACTTPPGHGGVSIVRLSGADAKRIARQLITADLKDRQAVFGQFIDAQSESIDSGIALYFQSPRSFTGEDVVELQCHGSPSVVDQLIRAAVAVGARMAQPGEFSERAFLEGKIDLVQAEAIADLIASGSDRSARAALRSLQGEFSKRIDQLMEQLVDLRVYIEASIDFPDEEIDFLASGQVYSRLSLLTNAVKALRAQADQGVRLQEGISLAIIGPPNAGKSSLLNRLAADDRAIVTKIPGTTRDVLREQITLKGLLVHVADTAGLRDTDDMVERAGIERAKAEALKSDVVVLVLDGSLSNSEEFAHAFLAQFGLEALHDRCLWVMNKQDLVKGVTKQGLPLSVKTGVGMDELVEAILTKIAYHGGEVSGFSARRRHVVAIDQAINILDRAMQSFESQHAGECLAEDLRLAHDTLGEITGQMHPDELLGRIFSDFCIGK